MLMFFLILWDIFSVWSFLSLLFDFKIIEPVPDTDKDTKQTIGKMQRMLAYFMTSEFFKYALTSELYLTAV